jgi:hypothetical protein
VYSIQTNPPLPSKQEVTPQHNLSRSSTICDLEDQREVKYEEGQKLADKYGMVFLETSAKSNANVETAFIALSKEILKKPKPQKRKGCIIM